jgi:hypothetical protein
MTADLGGHDCPGDREANQLPSLSFEPILSDNYTGKSALTAETCTRCLSATIADQRSANASLIAGESFSASALRVRHLGVGAAKVEQGHRSSTAAAGQKPSARSTPNI